MEITEYQIAELINTIECWPGLTDLYYYLSDQEGPEYELLVEPGERSLRQSLEPS